MGSALGGLQGIQFSICFPLSDLYMAGHVAVPDAPSDGWIRETDTIFSGGKFLDFLAAFTLLFNLVAVTSVKLATCFVHKETIHPFFQSLTNHGYHILSIHLLWDKK